MSAAIKASSPDQLRDMKVILKPLKLGKPLHEQQGFRRLRFWYSVPRQLDSLVISEREHFDCYTVTFDCDEINRITDLSTKTFRLMRSPSAAFESINFNMNDYLVGAGLVFKDNYWLMRFRKKSRECDLMVPWSGISGASVELGFKTRANEKPTNWTLDSLTQWYSSKESDVAKFKARSSELTEPLCSAFEHYANLGIKDFSAIISVYPDDYHNTVSALLEELPGYESTMVECYYCEGFDPWQRPAEADQGHTVRFPTYLKEIQGANVQVDVVHRPAGDCYYDLQVTHFDKPKVPPKVMESILEKIGSSCTLWEGDPFGRWE